MQDIIEKLENSLVQHGKFNDRIYLMKLDNRDCWILPKKLDALAVKMGYSKIFAKVPINTCSQFQSSGFTKEAYIPGFFKGQTPVYFMSKFIDKNRAVVPSDMKKEILDIINIAKSKTGKPAAELPTDCTIRPLTEKDVPALTRLYRSVFKTYPFPIFDDDYILKTMQEHILYFGLFQNDKLLAASSCETDKENLNVEMTDFATDPEHLGNGYAVHLLTVMDAEMQKQGFKTAYTIARSISHGMNITFAKRNYEFSGTLINNTNINGQIESMNVWHKKLI